MWRAVGEKKGRLDGAEVGFEMCGELSFVLTMFGYRNFLFVCLFLVASRVICFKRASAKIEQGQTQRGAFDCCVSVSYSHFTIRIVDEKKKKEKKKHH